MRVAFYTPYVPASSRRPSGDRNQARAILAGLRDAGHEVEVVSEFRTRYFWREPRRVVAFPGAVRAATVAARAFRPDVWLTFVTERHVPDALGPVVSARLGVPYLVVKAPSRSRFRRLARKRGLRTAVSELPGEALNSLALRRADRVLLNKVHDLDEHRRLRPWVAPKLGLLWPAVDTERFTPVAGDRAVTRRALGLPADALVVLSVSRLSPGRKNESVACLVEAASEVRRRHPQVHVAVVGDGSGRGEVAGLVARHPGAATLVGGIDHDELESCYAAADVFAFPGLGEHIGLVYLEAQAAGLPVVAFRNGGIPHIVRDGDTGLLVEPMDVAGMAAALERLVGDDGLRERMGRAAREHAVERHSRSAWAARLASELEAVVQDAASSSASA